MLHVTSLEKHYQSVTAVNGLTFEVNPGEIFALLGPNGAGKSSLVKMLVGFTQALYMTVCWLQRTKECCTVY